MIDLHLHLDGSLSPKLVLELAEKQGIDLPRQDDQTLEGLLSAPTDCQSLNEYLDCFTLPLRVLQSAEALERSAYELAVRLALQGLLYAEIRFAPQLHTEKGMTQAQAVEAVRRGIAAAMKEHREFQAQIILCCMRGGENEKNRETLRLASKFFEYGICAVDLAGAEAQYPTGEYRELFREATSLGLPFTIHAGEADGPQSIWNALSFGAKRIGHGVRCVNDPALVDFLAERQVPLELCPTSNLQTKAVPCLAEFPLRLLLKRGVPVTLNTDNMTVSGTTLAGEYRLAESLGLTEDERRKLLENGARAAFLSPEKKDCLIRKIKSCRWPEPER